MKIVHLFAVKFKSIIEKPNFQYYLYSLILLTVVFAKTNVLRGTSFYTPDSEFYLSLSTFGSEVTDRAPTPAYFFTRFGTVVPNYFLAKIFGPQLGLSIFRASLLIIILISSMYVINKLRIEKNIFKMIFVTFALTNSVIVSFIGDPYVTGTGITCVFANSAINQAYLQGRENNTNSYSITFILGLNSAWAIFINQQFFIFILLSNLLLLILNIRTAIIRLIKEVTFYVSGFTIGFVIFISLGKIVFPNLDWLATTTFYSKILKGASYSSSNFGWLPSTWHLVSLFLFVILLLSKNKEFFSYKTFHELNFLVIFLYFFIQSFFFHAVLMEANFYNAFLWPYLIFAAMSFITKSIDKTNVNNWYEFLLIILLVILQFVIGKMNYQNVYFFLVSFTIVAVSLLFLSVNSFSNKQSLIWLSIFILGMQASQSSVGPGNSVVNRIPFNKSFSGESTFDETSLRIEVQKWLISNTNRSNKIFVWVEPNSDLVRLAAMQLWGPNSIQTPDSKEDWNYQSLNAIQPDILVFYVRDFKQVDEVIMKLKVLGFKYKVRNCSSWNEDNSQFDVCISSRI